MPDLPYTVPVRPQQQAVTHSAALSSQPSPAEPGSQPTTNVKPPSSRSRGKAKPPLRLQPANTTAQRTSKSAMDDDDDFTFPTVAAARGPTTAPERQLGRDDDHDTVPHLLHLSAAVLPNLIAAGASTPLWPFAGSVVPKTMATTTAAPPVTADDEQGQASVPVSGSSSGRALRSAVPEEETCRVAADEDRMDLLWEAATTTAATTTRSTATASAPPEPRRVDGAHAGGPPAPPPPKQRADVDDDKQRAAALADAERMDKLWESFNEDLVLRHRQHRDRARRTKSAADHPGGSSRVVPRGPAGCPDDDNDDDDRWYLCSYDSPSSGAGDGSESDQETASASSPAERRGYGCAPTMLRASSRAGGAGQFCGAGATSPRTGRQRRGRRGAAAGWALLLRLFRRLFAVDKTTTAPSPPSSRRSHSSLYVP